MVFMIWYGMAVAKRHSKMMRRAELAKGCEDKQYTKVYTLEFSCTYLFLELDARARLCAPVWSSRPSRAKIASRRM